MTRATTDLAEWLGRYGLGRYTQAFIENHIEYAVLPDLTENDLKNLGVSLGHRKTLLRAIEALAAARQASGTTATASHLGTEALAPLERREAERRQITVMFSDLVGSTQLSEKLDPEDLQVLIDAYRDVCTTAVRRYQGHVARYFGDGVMAFFGWPRAHEDDAIRAVHAALEIVSAVTKDSRASYPGFAGGRQLGPGRRRGNCRWWDCKIDGYGCGGRDPEYRRAFADTCLAQHFSHLGVDETSRIGSLRFSGPWSPATQRRNQTSPRIPRPCCDEYREPNSRRRTEAPLPHSSDVQPN